MTEIPCKQNRVDLSPCVSRAASLYVHVPFCRRKCAYCDFASHVATDGEMSRYLRAVRSELRLHNDALYRPFRTCYLGGGTPTALGSERLGPLLEDLAGYLAADAEFSVEANPATVDRAMARALRDAGVNRVTLGAQSFHAAELEMLGRLHGAEDVQVAAGQLRDAGLENLAIDLIYAIPGQDLARWEANLDAAVALSPEHVSCYALSFEAGTELWARREARIVDEADEDLQRAMYDKAIEKLTAAGYVHYELSNFAVEGRACRHNLVYWHNEAYLGIGPAACSYVDGERRSTTRAFDTWLAALEQAPPTRPPCEVERLGLHVRMGEALMLGLRLTAGVDEGAFARRYGIGPLGAFPASLQRHLELGTLHREQGQLRLDREAYFTSDAVLADIIAEAIGLEKQGRRSSGAG